MRISLLKLSLIIAILSMPTYIYSYQLGDVELALKAGAQEGYDSNITYVKSGRKSDFFTSLNAAIEATLEGKTNFLQLTGSINHHFYQKNSDFDYTSEELTAQLLTELTDYDRITLKNTFSHTYEPRSFEESFGSTAGRYSYYRNRFLTTYTKDLTKELTLIGRYAYNIDDPSRSDLLNSYLHRLGCAANYSLSAQTIITGMYDFYYRQFGQSGPDATVHTLAPGIRQFFTNQLYFDARAGANFITSYNNRRYTKPHYFLSLTDEIDETTSSSISFTQEYSTTPSTEDVFDYWQVALNLVKQLNRRLGASASGFIGQGEYPTLAITDKLKGVSAGLTYDITEDITASLNYTYSRTDSSLDSREYAKNLIVSRIAITF